jgi:hypothetical protein
MTFGNHFNVNELYSWSWDFILSVKQNPTEIASSGSQKYYTFLKFMTTDALNVLNITVILVFPSKNDTVNTFVSTCYVYNWEKY